MLTATLPQAVTVVLAGGDPSDRLLSMLRYTRILQEGLEARGIKVVVKAPRPRLRELVGGVRKLAKAAAYLDKYLLFPLALRRQLCALRKNGPVIVHVTDQGNGLYLPWLRGQPRVVTIHDLLAIRAALGEFPHEQRRGIRTWGQRSIQRSLRSADSFICDSTKSQADSQRLLVPEAPRLFMVPPPVDAEYFGRTPPGHPDDLPPSYVLHVGNSSWYKNRAGMLRIHAAMRRLNPGSPPLVLIGDAFAESEQRAVQELGLEGQFILKVRPPDDYVKAAYASAKALVFPSLEEGFGWPVLEAMAAGCPVFTSNRPPMTETGGSVAEYIDPENPEAAASAILQCLSQGEPWRESKVQAGRQWAATFSSTRFIDDVINVYATTLRRHGAPTNP